MPPKVVNAEPNTRKTRVSMLDGEIDIGGKVIQLKELKYSPELIASLEKVEESVADVVSIQCKTEPTARKAKQISMLEHAKKKSMWSGSKNSQTIESYVLEDAQDVEGKVFQLRELKYPPALLKIIDEVIVNAIDHSTHYVKAVTEIKINVAANGEITVYNNGPGIPVEQTQNINNVVMYVPQLIASEFLAGDNLDDDGSNTKGGTNGIGLKLACAFSKILILETLDATHSLHYTQEFKEGLTVIEPPLIKSVAKSTKPFTRISFIPNYAEFKLDAAKFYPTLCKILETRAWQAASYTTAKVYYNDKLIPIKSFNDFCQMFTENEVFPCQLKKTSKPTERTWEIGIAVSDGKERHISIVNGVYMPKGGTHIQYIQNLLVANLRDRVEKEIKKSGVKFNKNFITNNIFIFMKGPIPSPEFLSQTKEAISDPIEKFAEYEFSVKDIAKIWELLEPAIMATFLKKQLGETKTRANRGKVDVPKYKEAKYCRNAKECHKCGLIVTEGDSASGTADIGLLAKASPDFNYDYFGVYSIGGVPVNGLKESMELKIKRSKDDSVIVHTTPKPRGKLNQSSDTASETSTDADNEQQPKPRQRSPNRKPKKKISLDDLQMPARRIPNKKIQENERIASLNKVLGLDFNKTYMLNEIGEREFKTLRYGFIVGLTDQDLDGFNIFGLLATYIMTYLPALIQRGFLRRIITPVIRAYPKNKKKNKVKEFYSEREAREWTSTMAEADVRSQYTFKYYKGLGSHKESFKEVSQMFKNINRKICTYTLDTKSFETMFIYYGEDTAPRKIHLANPEIDESIEGITKSITNHFNIDTKLYQRDNIIRKLLSVADGFVDSRRKVFYTARRNGRSEIKVQGLAGKVVAEANYHHGEASLEQTIIRMAQCYPMARNLPMLLPLGQFGTRAKGYKDHAASRYIYTMVNYRLTDKLFRKEDDYILEYDLIDGERYEPKYYVPIIPYVLCEDNEYMLETSKLSLKIPEK
jgi:DNA gyrase/topoisomerase IV subunit B